MRATLVRLLTAPPRALWRITGKPIHRRLFGAYFQATLNRLDSVLGELRDLSAELEELRRQVDESRAGQDELDRHIRTVIATHWDLTALTRRLGAIEDRLAISGPAAAMRQEAQDGANDPADGVLR
jgi:hypothetical protein